MCGGVPEGCSFDSERQVVIDQEKCIKCGKCVNACPYHAIIKLERPCAQACRDEGDYNGRAGRAHIDQDKCVSCGMCLVNCPFGAIADKGQIFQTILAIKSDTPVIPPRWRRLLSGQFGKELTPEKFRKAMQLLGFEDVVEVAVGADLCTIEEARDFINEVPEKLPFMGTSCCPSWSVMAKKLFPRVCPLHFPWH